MKSHSPNQAIDALADCVRDNVNMHAVAAMIDRPLPVSAT
jgi:hypothetical protein